MPDSMTAAEFARLVPVESKPRPLDGRLASTRDSAARFFKHHVATQLYGGVPIAATGDFKNFNGFVPAAWEFRAPGGSCIDAVSVSTLPGRLILTGDHGTCVWERTDDMIAWARSAIRSLDYFAEKVAREVRITEHDPERVDLFVWELDADARAGEFDAERTAAWYDLRDSVLGARDEPRHAYDLICPEWCDELPDFDSYTVRFLMQRQALLHFFHALYGDPLE